MNFSSYWRTICPFCQLGVTTDKHFEVSDVVQWTGQDPLPLDGRGLRDHRNQPVEGPRVSAAVHLEEDFLGAFARIERQDRIDDMECAFTPHNTQSLQH